jgi:preprotein translocase subunit YajC
MLEGIAYAMGAPGGGAGAQGAPGMFQSLLPLIIIFGIFYFMLIRPQQKKAREHKDMLEKLKKGDKIITSGGLYGEIYALTPTTVTLVIAEGVKVKVSRGFISGLAAPEEEKAA